MEHSLVLSRGEASLRTWMRRGLSVVLGGILVFELLNYTQILSFHVEYTWFGRLLSTLVIFLALHGIDEVFRRKLGARLQARVWVLITVLLISDFIGDLFGFYGRWVHYDQVIHFISGPFITASLVLAVETVATRLAWNVPKAVTYLLALGTNTIFAVLYEAEEYLEDFVFHTNRLGDGPDTANDLLLNFLGGLLIIFIFVVYRSWKHRKIQNRSRP